VNDDQAIVQSPMALVILGGLLSSTFLNLVLVPVLFARWGGTEPEPHAEGMERAEA
jgi:Cu/Ag efflux pump CusA